MRRAGVRGRQAARAAELLGADRVTLGFQDRMIRDTPECPVTVAKLIREHRPRFVFTSEGSGVRPDHRAVTDIVANAVFYARLPKWHEVPGGDALAGTAPHEIARLFYGHCRMECPWERLDFVVDLSDFYTQKVAALALYESVFSGDKAELLDRYSAEDRYVGSSWGCALRRRSRPGVPFVWTIRPSSRAAHSGATSVGAGARAIRGEISRWWRSADS